jgi:predicted nucleotidyltransferase component of viral defense system
MSISPLSSLLKSKNLQSTGEYRHAVKEIIQKICLLGLWRGSFFEHAAFYGGTALSMLHGLDRFSEDLDFSLLQENPDFRLNPYLDYVSRELAAWGISAETDHAVKKHSAIESAFIKTNTLNTLMKLHVPISAIKALHRDEISTVKFEIDPHPPCEFNSISSYILEPIPFSVRVMSLSDLFAGKMHAVLARGWKTRVKGRDWYDLLWYVRNGTDLNLQHLESRLRQSGHWNDRETICPDSFRKILRDRINQIDFGRAKEDVLPFIPNVNAVQNWSRELFLSLVDRIQVL